MSLANDLGTNVDSFRQTYLGLPIPPHKLPPSAYQLIDNFDWGVMLSRLDPGMYIFPFLTVLFSLESLYINISYKKNYKNCSSWRLAPCYTVKK